jgi:hypothetical protein
MLFLYLIGFVNSINVKEHPNKESAADKAKPLVGQTQENNVVGTKTHGQDAGDQHDYFKCLHFLGF